MAHTSAEIEGYSIVILGSFNPKIIHPHWLEAHGFIDSDEAEAAQINSTGNDFSEIRTTNLKITCLQNRFSIETLDASLRERVKELTVQFLEILPHTPIAAIGINPKSDYLVSTCEYWNKIGHSLAPKGLVWEHIGNKPGLINLTIQIDLESEYSNKTNISVGPSAAIKAPRYGVYIGANCHFQVDELEKDSLKTASKAKEIIENEWDTCCKIVHKTATTLFQNINE